MRVALVAKSDIDTAIDLANTLHELDISVNLYFSHAHFAREMDDADQPVERLYDLELLPPACRVRLFKLPRMRDPRSFIVMRRLAQIIRDDGVDIVHVLSGPDEFWLAVLACLFRGFPVASTMIVPKQNIGDHPPQFITFIINKLLTLGSDVVIVNGKDQVSLVQKLYHVPSNRIVYIRLGARTTAVKWSCRKINEEPGTVLFFGRTDQYKGLEYLVRAQPVISHHLPYARILIAGRGKDLERCLNLIQDKSKFEIHDGFFTGDVAAAFFERASLVAIPYISASTSGVLLTAYGFGKPVVTTNVGCLSEYVKEGVTGLMIPPRDSERLAKAIIHLLSDDALRHKMGEEAKRWVGNEEKELARQTLKVYEKAISTHNKRY